MCDLAQKAIVLFSFYGLFYAFDLWFWSSFFLFGRRIPNAKGKVLIWDCFDLRHENRKKIICLEIFKRKIICQKFEMLIFVIQSGQTDAFKLYHLKISANANDFEQNFQIARRTSETSQEKKLSFKLL